MEYYGSKIKDLLNITIPTKKTISCDDLRNRIIENKDKIFKQINNGRYVNPNVIFLLYECGIKLKQYTKSKSSANRKEKTIVYNLTYNNEIIFKTEYPVSVNIIFKILKSLSKYKYFQKKYMNKKLLKDHLFKVEEVIINPYSDNPQEKNLDLAIYSHDNKNCLICVEINEYTHKSKVPNDNKRCDDLICRFNEQRKKISKIFITKLNKDGFIPNDDIDNMSRDIIKLLIDIDYINEERKFVVYRLVKGGIGDKKLCELLYDSHNNKNEYNINIYDLYIKFKNMFVNEYQDKIIDIFISYQKDNNCELEEKEDEIKKLMDFSRKKSQKVKKNNVIFDGNSDSENSSVSESYSDSDSNLNSDLESESDCYSDIDDFYNNSNKYQQNLEEKRICFRELGGGIFLNFFGVSKFIKFIADRDSKIYFKDIRDHEYVSDYFDRCQNYMINATKEIKQLIDELNDCEKRKIIYGSHI
jgi:hypothetical protein